MGMTQQGMAKSPTPLGALPLARPRNLCEKDGRGDQLRHGPFNPVYSCVAPAAEPDVDDARHDGCTGRTKKPLHISTNRLCSGYRLVRVGSREPPLFMIRRDSRTEQREKARSQDSPAHSSSPLSPTQIIRQDIELLQSRMQ